MRRTLSGERGDDEVIMSRGCARAVERGEGDVVWWCQMAVKAVAVRRSEVGSSLVENFVPV